MGKMLMKTSLPSSDEADQSCVSKHGLQDLSCDWMPGAETWKMCTKCVDHCNCRNAQLTSEENENAKESHNSLSIMSDSSAANLVCKKRKLEENTNSDAPSLATEEQFCDAQKVHKNGPCFCIRESDVSNSKSFFLVSIVEGLVVNEAPKRSASKVLEGDSVNDSCSSSKTNREDASASFKTEVDETGECSTSSAIVTEAVGDLSTKDLCTSILKSHGLLGEVGTTRSCGSAENIDASSSKSCQRSCKICNRPDTSLKMLICDNCEEAFHMSCCQPRMKKVPIDEWFCHSCLRSKQAILKERVTKTFPNITSVMSRNTSSKDQVNPILLMLRDTEPYRTCVRFGKGFQAEVNDWSGPGPINNDSFGEPLELASAEYARLDELDSSKPSRLCSTSNWIQCRAVVDRENGTICGKWRRAPLYEVQTDEWECFCSILWDPSRADCNAPQELETSEVLKQLKVIEKLRPRLSPKQRNLDRSNSTGDLQNHRVEKKLKTSPQIR